MAAPPYQVEKIGIQNEYVHMNSDDNNHRLVSGLKGGTFEKGGGLVASQCSLLMTFYSVRAISIVSPNPVNKGSKPQFALLAVNPSL